MARTTNPKVKAERAARRAFIAAHPYFAPQIGDTLVLNGNNSEVIFGGHHNGDKATVVAIRNQSALPIPFWVELLFEDGTNGGTDKDILGADVTYFHFNKV